MPRDTINIASVFLFMDSANLKSLLLATSKSARITTPAPSESASLVKLLRELTPDDAQTKKPTHPSDRLTAPVTASTDVIMDGSFSIIRSEDIVSKETYRQWKLDAMMKLLDVELDAKSSLLETLGDLIFLCQYHIDPESFNEEETNKAIDVADSIDAAQENIVHKYRLLESIIQRVPFALS
jgi:hypothetical protein